MGENIPVVRQIIHISAPCTLESYHITAEYVIIKILLLYSGPPRGGGRGGGQIAPGPEVLGAPFLCVKYFRAKDKVSGFLG
jgi:hypothetical protein